MKLNKIIYDIRESVKEFTDDSELDDRYIVHLLNIKRSKYLRQELNNSQRTSDITTLQTLTVPLISVSRSECNINTSCEQIMRTCKVIPDTLQLHTKDSIIRIASIDRLSKPFNYITKDKALYTGSSEFPNSIYSFINDDGYIYIISNNKSIKLLECVSISGIFEDPTELSNFTTCCNCIDSSEDGKELCFTSDSDYPIQPHLLDIVIEEIVLKLLRNKHIQEDKINDGDS